MGPRPRSWSSTPEGPAVLTRLCRVPSPRVFSLRLEQTRPHFCKAGLAALCCPQESRSSGPSSSWAVTRPTPWPLSWLLFRPTSSLSRTLHHTRLASWPRCPPIQPREGVSNSSDRLSLALGASLLSPSLLSSWCCRHDNQLTLSLPPDHCPRSIPSGNPFLFCDVCPMPSILGDLAVRHLLQAAFLDFWVRLRALCPPITLGLLLLLAVVTVAVWSFATFLITGDGALTLSLRPCPSFVSGADVHIGGPGQCPPELLGEPPGWGGR